MTRPVMSPGTLYAVPNAPKTPVKCFRVPESEYRAAMDTAGLRGEVLSDEVRKFLRRYAKKKPKETT